MDQFDPYKVLDVPQDFDANKLKQAYRKASSSAHPDKGGTTEQMQAVNRANDILSDPEKRKQWDETGSDEQKPEDSAARRALKLFSDFLIDALDEPGNVVTYMQGRIDKARKNAKTEQRKAKEAVAKLRQRRELIKLKVDGENLIHQIMDGLCASGQKQIDLMEEVLTTLKGAEELLAQCESAETSPAAQHRPFDTWRLSHG